MFCHIWSGRQADTTLMNLEHTESPGVEGSWCRPFVAYARMPILKALRRDASLIWQLGEATFRSTVAVDAEDGADYVKTYKRMSWTEMTA